MAKKQVYKLANKPSVLYKKDFKYKSKSKVIILKTSTDEQEEDNKDINKKSVVKIAVSTPT